MTFAIFGLAVSQGIAIGRAHLMSHATLEVSQYTVRDKDVVAEVERLGAAFATVRLEMESLREEATAPGVPAEMEAFLDMHGMILDDPMLSAGATALIHERRCNAEWALVQQMDQLVAQFDEFEDAYLRERSQDVVQVCERVIKALLGKSRKIARRGKDKDDELIIVAHDLSPADTLQFKNLRIGGFVTDLGGATSHTAIVARSLAIPAVVGMQHARPLINDHDLLILDGSRGVLIVGPDERILEEYRLRKTELELDRSKLKRLKTAPSVTLDEVAISLQANIEVPADMEQVNEAGADGVGLYRTEFLFMGRDDLPDEDEQFEAYRSVAKAMSGKPVTIRTLDIGADKTARTLRRDSANEPNPALGLRAIRLCLSEPQLFLSQLRAILRASHYGKVKLLVPMLAHAHEINQTLNFIHKAKEQLRVAKIKFDENIDIGAMIEIPAAALALGPFLRNLDFLSIGTNDLIQYTLAIDRTDQAVAHLYDPLHPAVLRLIYQTIQAGNKAGLPVSVCGEMAGDPQLAGLLLGMGLRQFSMHPSQILEVKQQILTSDVSELAGKVARLLRLDQSDKIKDALTKINAGKTSGA